MVGETLAQKYGLVNTPLKLISLPLMGCKKLGAPLIPLKRLREHLTDSIIMKRA